MYLCKCICVYICVDVCAYIYIYVYVHMQMHIMRIGNCIYIVYVSVYVYIDVCTHYVRLSNNHMHHHVVYIHLMWWRLLLRPLYFLQRSWHPVKKYNTTSSQVVQHLPMRRCCNVKSLPVAGYALTTCYHVFVSHEDTQHPEKNHVGGDCGER